MIGSFWFNSFSAGGGGAASDYELISTTVLGSSAASVTFSGLGTSAAAYKHLQLRLATRSSNAANSDTIFINLNGDSGANYSTHVLRGYGGSVTSSSWTSQTNMFLPSQTTGATNATSNFAPAIIDLLDFASTTKNKTMRALSGFADPSYAPVALTSGAWLSTSAVTSIALSISGANFVTGSRFSLYGLR